MIDSLFLLADIVAMVLLMRWAIQDDDKSEGQE